jgi:hypothetical protein
MLQKGAWKAHRKRLISNQLNVLPSVTHDYRPDVFGLAFGTVPNRSGKANLGKHSKQEWIDREDVDYSVN